MRSAGEENTRIYGGAGSDNITWELVSAIRAKFSPMAVPAMTLSSPRA